MGRLSSPHTDCLADELTAYLEALTITQGFGAGLPMFVMPWEERFLRGTFTPDVGTSALTLGRNNGKTGFVGALGAAAVTGPLAQPRAEVALVAASFKQARLLFGHAKAYLRPEWERHPRDWRVSDTSNLARLEHRPTGIVLTAHAAKAETIHGLAPSLALLDEPAQWPAEESEGLLAGITSGMGKLVGGKVIAFDNRTGPRQRTILTPSALGGRATLAWTTYRPSWIP